MGVQRLGYLEFGELRRVAQRTIEQRQIFINNLAIRRAIEELKVTRDYDELCRILIAAFSSNDFDAFEVRAQPAAELPYNRGWQMISGRAEDPFLHWKRPGSHLTRELGMAWSLTLDLVATNNRRWGSMTVYRLYTARDLQLDVNLLTSIFPVALGDALDRTLSQPVELAPSVQKDPGFMAAQAG
jgi:hypothetical protein